MDMISADDIKALLMQYLTTLPYLVVVAVGFAFSLFKYRAHPKVFLLTATGTVVLFVVRVVQIPVYYLLPRMFAGQNLSHLSMAQAYGVLATVWGLLSTVGLAFILAAVFVGRGKGPGN